MSRALVVDDDRDFGKLVALHLAHAYEVDYAPDAQQALALLERTAYDVVLTDLHMPPGLDGIELLREARRREVDAPFLVLTGQATIETAVQAMREGAYDYLRKTASPDELRAAAARAVEHGRMTRELGRLRGEVEKAVGATTERPIGGSDAIRRVLELAERVASSEASVLILGESGTGKELLARAIHRWSGRAHGPFVAFDCSALAPSLVESELFGHERGAFTGAHRARRGLFREATDGTLLLDEVGDLAPEVQNKLLRVLQEREVRPVGGDKPVKIDVRLLAATNKDLRRLVAEGRFREDLYYRLAVVPIELPPLRARREDIPLLAVHFLTRRRGAGPHPARIASEALARLSEYSWPGNIRELENVIERAAILSNGREVRIENLPPLPAARASAPMGGEAQSPPSAVSAASGSSPPGPAPITPALGPAMKVDGRPLKELLDAATEQVERAAIQAALRAESGSATRAARRLGISRAAFYNKLKRHGIVV